MGRVDGTPQDDKYRDLGGREIPPRHMRDLPPDHTDDAGGGGSNNKSGCALVLLGLAGVPWLADLLLVAS